MAEFIVAIDRITYYAVQAEDEITAIDLALEGQGEEVTADTRDAYMDLQHGSCDKTSLCLSSAKRDQF